MNPKSTLMFRDGRIADIAKATSPVLLVFVDTERHIFSQDDASGRFYVEVTEQRLISDDLTWVQ